MNYGRHRSASGAAGGKCGESAVNFAPGHPIPSDSCSSERPLRVEPVAADVEIRRNDDGTLDEVVAPNLHLEQMDNNHWWMAIYTKDGRVTVNFHARGNISAFVEEEFTNPFATKGGA